MSGNARKRALVKSSDDEGDGQQDKRESDVDALHVSKDKQTGKDGEAKGVDKTKAEAHGKVKGKGEGEGKAKGQAKGHALDKALQALDRALDVEGEDKGEVEGEFEEEGGGGGVS